MAHNLERQYAATCPKCGNSTGSFVVSRHIESDRLIGKCFDESCGFTYGLKDALLGKPQPWSEDSICASHSGGSKHSKRGSTVAEVPHWLEEAYSNGESPPDGHRGIPAKVYEQFGVRQATLIDPETRNKEQALLFPYTDGVSSGYKVRFMHRKSFSQYVASDKYFGCVNRKEVVVTSGEFDALTVPVLDSYLSVFNLPSDSNVSVVGKYLETLSKFKTIYLAVDQDESGRRAEEKLLHKLPQAKVVRLPAGIKDLNQLLTEYGLVKAKEVWKTALFSAAKYSSPFIMDGAELIEQALNYRDAEDLSRTTGIPALDNTIGGYRPGEKTVLLAYPGTGKSTLSRSMLYANIQAGIHTVVVTTESSEPPAKWLHNMWHIHNSFYPTDKREYMEQAVRHTSFVKPTHFAVEAIAPAIDGALSYADAPNAVVLLDNITSVVKVGASYWDGVSTVVQGLNTVLNKHSGVSLVIAAHPTKGEGATKPEKLSITSIDGGQALSQFSDNVLVLYRTGDGSGSSALRVLKRRANVKCADYAELEFNANYSYIMEPINGQEEKQGVEEQEAGLATRVTDMEQSPQLREDPVEDEAGSLGGVGDTGAVSESRLSVSQSKQHDTSSGVEGIPERGEKQPEVPEVPVGDGNAGCAGEAILRPDVVRGVSYSVSHPKTGRPVRQRGDFVEIPSCYKRTTLKERAPRQSFHAGVAEELCKYVLKTWDTGGSGEPHQPGDS